MASLCGGMAWSGRRRSLSSGTPRLPADAISTSPSRRVTADGSPLALPAARSVTLLGVAVVVTPGPAELSVVADEAFGAVAGRQRLLRGPDRAAVSAALVAVGAASLWNLTVTVGR